MSTFSRRCAAEYTQRSSRANVEKIYIYGEWKKEAREHPKTVRQLLFSLSWPKICCRCVASKRDKHRMKATQDEFFITPRVHFSSQTITAPAAARSRGFVCLFTHNCGPLMKCVLWRREESRPQNSKCGLQICRRILSYNYTKIYVWRKLRICFDFVLLTHIFVRPDKIFTENRHEWLFCWFFAAESISRCRCCLDQQDSASNWQFELIMLQDFITLKS